MKKLILLSALLLASFSLMQAQSKVASDIYQNYADGEHVLSMSLNYDLVDILDLDLDLDDQLRHISGDVYQVKFIVFGEEANPETNLSAIDKKLSSSDMVAIPVPDEVEEEDFKIFRFYGVRQGNHYSDICLLMLSADGETGMYLAVNGKIKIRRAS